MGKNDGKHIFGVVKVGEKGQIVIPKAARDVFKIAPGDSLLILGDENEGGMAMVKVDIFQQVADVIMNSHKNTKKKPEAEDGDEEETAEAEE